MKGLSSRISTIKPSASMKASVDAQALRAKGVDVIDLGLGEPDFPTPEHIVNAAFEAARCGEIRYTAAHGTAPLREAVAAKFSSENGIDCTFEDVSVANGAKQLIFNALLATLEPGDEVLLLAPYFVSYPEMVKLLGGVPRYVECPARTGFKVTAEQLDQAIGPRTKWLFLNSPNNPTGAVYSQEELAELGRVLDRHPDVLVLSDEIYEHTLFDGGKFSSFGFACAGLRDRTLIVNGVSKTYAMTGWRVGYAVGPKPLLRAMGVVQSQSVTSVSAVAQAAAMAALTGPQECVRLHREAFEQRRDCIALGVRDISGLSLTLPASTFYAYINCTGVIGRQTPTGERLADDTAVVDYLLNTGHVSSVPGAAYGLSPYFRISTASRTELLVDAVDRIRRAIDMLN